MESARSTNRKRDQPMEKEKSNNGKREINQWKETDQPVERRDQPKERVGSINGKGGINRSSEGDQAREINQHMERDQPVDRKREISQWTERWKSTSEKRY